MNAFWRRFVNSLWACDFCPEGPPASAAAEAWRAGTCRTHPRKRRQKRHSQPSVVGPSVICHLSCAPHWLSESGQTFSTRHGTAWI
jgi:hypothetical protein